MDVDGAVVGGGKSARPVKAQQMGVVILDGGRPENAKFRRVNEARPYWPEDICAEGQAMIHVGKETYWVAGDGNLMPVKKGQAPPDLRYFKPSPK